MKSFDRSSFTAALLAGLVTSLAFAGCSSNSASMKADVFGQNSQQQSQQIFEVMPGQKPLYDQAYNKLKSYFPPENPVGGAVLAANLKSKEEIAGFFDRLQKSQHYQTVVILMPTNLAVLNKTQNVGAVGVKPIAAVGNLSYKTSYGLLTPPSDLLQKIPAETFLKIDDANAIAKREVWPGTVAPFIARSFQGTNFLPVFVDENASPADTEKLAAWLNDNLPADTLVIAQTVPKTSGDQTVAEFQLKFIENVLENFDADKFAMLPLNNTAAVDVLEKYLFKRKAQHLQNQFMDPVTGNFISFSSDGPLIQSRSIYMVAFGDLMFDRVVRSLMDSHSMDYPFQKMDQTYLKSNDILIANLEGPIAKQRVQTSKEIAFRFNPDIVPLLQKYFFDALSQANNHALDMGVTGFNDTFDLLAQTAIKAFGDPRQIDDRSVATFDVQGQKIAFLGLEEVVYKIDDAKAVAKIQELTAQGYKVIPFMHWGIEYQHRPNNRQVQLAHEFIDAGAIAVIGCHPHVVETYETYKNRPIFYSLGNAIFDQYFSPDTQEGLSTAMIISNDQIEIYFLPIKIDRSQFRLMTADERKQFLERFVTYGDYQTEAEREEILSGKLVLNLN